MTTTGWIFLAIAWTLIIGLVVFCYGKIFRGTTRYE